MNAAMKNLVSIITPCYNCARFIAQAIESVRAQSYAHWEMIIVDDGSTDSPGAVVRRYVAQDQRIRFLQLPENVGVSKARNAAIAVAAGRYIAFLDSDDWWLPDKLQTQLAFMQKHHLAFTYASYQIVDEDGNPLGRFITQKEITHTRLLKTCDVGCSTVLYDRQQLGRVYMPEVFKREDYAAWLQILKKIQRARGLLQPLAVYRVRKHSWSSNKLAIIRYQWRVYRQSERLSIIASAYYFMHYICHGVLKTRRARP